MRYDDPPTRPRWRGGRRHRPQPEPQKWLTEIQPKDIHIARSPDGHGAHSSNAFNRHQVIRDCLDGWAPLNLLGQTLIKSIDSEIAALFQNTVEIRGRLFFRYGRLAGRVSRMKIKLPVESETLLASEDLTGPSATVDFHDKLTGSDQQAFHQMVIQLVAGRNLLPRIRKYKQIRKFFAEGIVEETEVEQGQPGDPGSGTEASTPQCFVGSLLEMRSFYMPQSELHLQLICESRRPCLRPVGDPITQETREIHTYIFSDGIEWQLDLIRLESATDRDDEENDIYYARFGLTDKMWDTLAYMVTKSEVLPQSPGRANDEGANGEGANDQGNGATANDDRTNAATAANVQESQQQGQSSATIIRASSEPRTVSSVSAEGSDPMRRWIQEFRSKLLPGISAKLYRNARLFCALHGTMIVGGVGGSVGTTGSDGSMGQPEYGYYYPNIFGDSVAEVRKHYNLKKIDLAGFSAIELVRRTNNMAKRLWIDKYVPPHSYMLDLACGHGQDLLKIVNKDLKLYIGIDVSNEEIREARYRVQQRKNLPPCRFHVGNILLPESYAKFLRVVQREEDAQREIGGSFDVVSCQLAIHYALDCEANARIVLGSISKHLKQGGIFIGSCPNCFVISERIRAKLRREFDSENKPVYKFGNSVYSVSFTVEDFAKIRGTPETENEINQALSARGEGDDGFANSFNQEEPPVRLPGDRSLPSNPWIEEYLSSMKVPMRIPLGYGQQMDTNRHIEMESDHLMLQLSERWGLRYWFWLIDHIDVPEYNVPWRAFCRLALELGLKCIHTVPFDEYIQQAAQQGIHDAVNYQDRANRMAEQSSTAQDQTQVISFYQLFLFQKM